MAYGAQYPEAEHQIIVVEGLLAGRLLVNRSPLEIRLVDISLLPQYRNQGIGASVVRHLQAEAESAGRPLTLHVARTNEAAIRFYRRLEFVEAGETGSHLRMEWLARQIRENALASAGTGEIDQPASDRPRS
jgi:ribosomal protein S18 acetylase RimI-like enzyme